MILSNDLTRGSLFPKMMKFAIPYLGACFLQTFYGMADLFITGQYNGAAPVTGVSIGSQVMHMMIVIIAGLTLGCAVSIAGNLGARDEKNAFHFMGSAAVLFLPFAFLLMALLFILMPFILSALQTPQEAWDDTRAYLSICFAGIPFIVLYNMVSGFFRGMGNTRTPMVIVALAGIIKYRPRFPPHRLIPHGRRRRCLGHLCQRRGIGGSYSPLPVEETVPSLPPLR